MGHDLRALSREWFDVVWNRRDDAGIAKLASPQMICHGLDAAGKTAPGLDTFLQMRRAFLSAFPDIRVTVDDVLLDGDKTAIRISFTGTHHGDGIGVAPTGNVFTSTAIVIARWRDGKIVEAWNELDVAGMMRQLQSPTAKLKV